MKKALCSFIIILVAWQSIRMIFGSDIMTGNEIYIESVTRINNLYADINKISNNITDDLKDLQKKAQISQPFDDIDTIDDTILPAVNVNPDADFIERIASKLDYIVELFKSLLNTIVKILNGTISGLFDFAISSITFISTLIWILQIILNLGKFLLD